MTSGTRKLTGGLICSTVKYMEAAVGIEKDTDMRMGKRLAVLEARTNLRFAFVEKARKLQAREYERRLEILNHEADQLKAMRAELVPRETHNLLVEKVEHLQSWKDGSNSRVITIAGITASACSVIITLLHYVFTK